MSLKSKPWCSFTRGGGAIAIAKGWAIFFGRSFPRGDGVIPLWQTNSTTRFRVLRYIVLLLSHTLSMQALREGADGADHEEPHPRLLLLLRHGLDLPKPVQASLVFFPWL